MWPWSPKRAFSLKYEMDFLNASEFVSLSRARMRAPMAVRGRLAPELPVYPNPPLPSWHSSRNFLPLEIAWSGTSIPAFLAAKRATI
ncbi:MAG: hypothetical protein CMI24_05785 [Opitutae bacterium]|nr:hypothetical protein [Opitutae bacterium]